MVLLCGHIDTGTPTTEFPAKDLNEFMTAEKHATNCTACTCYCGLQITTTQNPKLT